MKIKLLFSLITLIFTTPLFSQNNEAFKTYKMNSIYLQGGKYIKNDVAYPMGFFGENLREEMKISPHATAEWNKHVTFRNWSFVTSLTGVALTVAAIGAEDNNNSRNLVLAGLGLSIVSIPLSIKSKNQLDKAIWTHNRDLFEM